MAQAQPRLPEVARRRLVGLSVELVVVAVRRDGTPRLSPIEPMLLAGDLEPRAWRELLA